jgi:acylphosphatase
MTIRRRVIVTGRVHGVGYGQSWHVQAAILSVGGRVRYVDGTVETVVRRAKAGHAIVDEQAHQSVEVMAVPRVCSVGPEVECCADCHCPSHSYESNVTCGPDAFIASAPDSSDLLGLDAPDGVPKRALPWQPLPPPTAASLRSAATNGRLGGWPG